MLEAFVSAVERADALFDAAPGPDTIMVGGHSVEHWRALHVAHQLAHDCAREWARIGTDPVWRAHFKRDRLDHWMMAQAARQSQILITVVTERLREGSMPTEWHLYELEKGFRVSRKWRRRGT